MKKKKKKQSFTLYTHIYLVWHVNNTVNKSSFANGLRKVYAILQRTIIICLFVYETIPSLWIFAWETNCEAEWDAFMRHSFSLILCAAKGRHFSREKRSILAFRWACRRESAIVNKGNKMSNVSDRDGFYPRSHFWILVRFADHALANRYTDENIYMRWHWLILALARGSPGGILVLAHVWLLVKKFRCELREELVIRETRAGFLRARNPDRRCRVVEPVDEKSSLLSRSRDFLTGWTLSRRAPTYTHLRTSGCEIPVDARRKRIRPTVMARACASVRISVSPARTQVSRHARNVIIVGHRDEGNVSETHESANLCRDEWQP